MKVDDFVGKVFSIGEGTTYTVIKDKDLKGKYTLSCSVCSLDKELWPDGSIKVKYEKLKVGRVPCGCSVSTNYTKQQDLIRMNRLCLGTTFSVIKDKPTNNNRGKYTLNCSICSSDTELWAQDSIKVSYDKFKSGRVPCGCSLITKWTEAQFVTKIQRICTSEGLTYLGWQSEFKTVKSRLLWRCPYGIVHDTELNGFLNCSQRCRCMNVTGYSTKKNGNLYITKWDTHEPTVKFGVTNRDVVVRLKEHHRKNNVEFELLYVWEGYDGALILEIENHLKSMIKNKEDVPRDVLPSGWTEAFYFDGNLVNVMVDYTNFRLNNKEKPSISL